KKIIKQQSNLNMELFKYINGIDPTCILIYGNWGSGKTISVNEFMDHIKKINYRKVYTISCFGISTREALYKKIQDECENEDKSLKRRVVDISKSIPVIGNLIYSLLKKIMKLLVLNLNLFLYLMILKELLQLTV
ncbi:P-loop NTPase fold protein, partial [Anaerosporobacter sp.]